VVVKLLEVERQVEAMARARQRFLTDSMYESDQPLTPCENVAVEVGIVY